MDPTFRKIALVVATFGLLLSLFLALRPTDDGDTAAAPTTTAVTTVEEPPATTAEEPPPPTTTEPLPATTVVEPVGPARVTIRLRVRGGQPVGGIRRPQVKQGRQVVIVTTADVSDHIHLHGYDLMAEVAPGSPARLRFTADIPGRFEIELEDRGIQIADLEVRP